MVRLHEVDYLYCLQNSLRPMSKCVILIEFSFSMFLSVAVEAGVDGISLNARFPKKPERCSRRL